MQGVNRLRNRRHTSSLVYYPSFLSSVPSLSFWRNRSSLLCLTQCDSLVLILSPLPLSVLVLLSLFSAFPLSSYILFSQEDKTNCVIFIPPSHLSPAYGSPIALSNCIHPLSPRSIHASLPPPLPPPSTATSPSSFIIPLSLPLSIQIPLFLLFLHPSFLSTRPLLWSFFPFFFLSCRT